jgi:drug/metabolite transporter (DMT)-like permease
MNTRSGRLAILILGLCCVAWGFSFPAMQISATVVERLVLHGNEVVQSLAQRLSLRGGFNAWRFAIAGLVCAAISLRGSYRRQELLGGTVVGLFFGLGMLFQLLGIQCTLPSVSSFLTALSVVFAPIAQSLLLRRPVGGRVWLAVAIAVLGMAVLSLGDAGAARATLTQAPPVPFLGQILTVIGAGCFTAQILAVDHFGKRADPSRMTTVMLLSAAVVSALVGLAAGGWTMYRVTNIVALARDFTFDWSFAGLVLLSSVLAMTLMNAWQPRIAPATAAVVYCLEPVFGTLFSVAFGTEVLTGVTVVGGLIILAAVLMIARRPEESAENQIAEAPAAVAGSE